MKEKIQHQTAIIDSMAAFYRGETRLRVVTNEGDQNFGTSWLEEGVYLGRTAFIIKKGRGTKDQVTIYLEMSITELW